MRTGVENVVAFGDSISQGIGVPDRSSWLKRLEQHFYDLNQDNPRAVFSDLSYVGDTTTSLVQRIAAELPSRLRPNRRHLSVVAVGTQDVWAAIGEHGFINRGSHPALEKTDDNIYRAIFKLLEYGDVLVVGPVTCNTRMTSLYGRPDLEGQEQGLQRALRLVNERIGEACLVAFDPPHGVYYVDLLRDSQQDSDFTLARDGVHPDEQGHDWIYQRVVPYFDRLVTMPELSPEKQVVAW